MKIIILSIRMRLIFEENILGMNFKFIIILKLMSLMKLISKKKRIITYTVLKSDVQKVKF